MRGITFLFFLLFCSTYNLIAQEDRDRSSYTSDLETMNDTVFVNVKKYSDGFLFDLKYATKDNFLGTDVYPCGECYLRLKTMKHLLLAAEEFKNLGYKIKLFDCYRPLDVQKKMWKIMPDPSYVANPEKGSIHNRGGAVDLTLVSIQTGKELDMGTPFDHFGEMSSHYYKVLENRILENRKMLKEIMEKHGFLSLSSEWWHYNLPVSQTGSVSNFIWDCP